MIQRVIHYPNLKTVISVEKILRGADLMLTREDIKRKLPAGIMHQTLNVILEYLAERGLIIDGKKGILWAHNDDPRLKAAIMQSREW
ncbi:hypothetical protein HZA97_02085 [Candidatus Woesearchaeota archaeon]|nr:hypothetical protein [Candidatus Woesearchaeota archaeon]